MTSTPVNAHRGSNCECRKMIAGGNLPLIFSLDIMTRFDSRTISLRPAAPFGENKEAGAFAYITYVAS